MRHFGQKQMEGHRRRSTVDAQHIMRNALGFTLLLQTPIHVTKRVLLLLKLTDPFWCRVGGSSATVPQVDRAWNVQAHPSPRCFILLLKSISQLQGGWKMRKPGTGAQRSLELFACALLFGGLELPPCANLQRGGSVIRRQGRLSTSGYTPCAACLNAVVESVRIKGKETPFRGTRKTGSAYRLYIPS